MATSAERIHQRFIENASQREQDYDNAVDLLQKKRTYENIQYSDIEKSLQTLADFRTLYAELSKLDLDTEDATELDMTQYMQLLDAVAEAEQRYKAIDALVADFCKDMIGVAYGQIQSGDVAAARNISTVVEVTLENYAKDITGSNTIDDVKSMARNLATAVEGTATAPTAEFRKRLFSRYEEILAELEKYSAQNLLKPGLSVNIPSPDVEQDFGRSYTGDAILAAVEGKLNEYASQLFSGTLTQEERDKIGELEKRIAAIKNEIESKTTRNVSAREVSQENEQESHESEKEAEKIILKARTWLHYVGNLLNIPSTELTQKNINDAQSFLTFAEESLLPEINEAINNPATPLKIKRELLSAVHLIRSRITSLNKLIEENTISQSGTKEEKAIAYIKGIARILRETEIKLKDEEYDPTHDKVNTKLADGSSVDLSIIYYLRDQIKNLEELKKQSVLSFEYAAEIHSLIEKIRSCVEKLEDRIFDLWKRQVESESWWVAAINLLATEPIMTNLTTANQALNRSNTIASVFNSEIKRLQHTLHDSKRKEHVQTVTKSLDSRIERIRERIASYEEEKRNKDLEDDFTQRTQGLNNVLNEVFGISARTTKIDESELHELQERLKAEYTRLLNADVFNFHDNVQLRYKVEKLREQYTNALGVIESELKLPSVESMSPFEVIAELRKRGVDPVAANYGKDARDDRASILSRQFVRNSNMYLELTNFSERFDLLVQQVNYLLELMVGKQDQGKGYASNPRENLTSMLNAYMLKREQILLAATYHPIWGSQVREMLKTTTEIAAKGNFQFPDGNFFNYNLIVSSQGQVYLNKFINDRFGSYHEQARHFTELLFVAFDFPDIVLEQWQRKANGTRKHNQSEKFDPIFLQDPIASFEQNWDRYGANLADWRAWFTVFVQDIPKNGLYGAAGKAESTIEFQQFVLAYYDQYFPVEDLVDRQPVAGFCESYFPNAYDMLTLNETAASDPKKRLEVLDLLGTGRVKGRNATSTTDTALPLDDWDGYDVTATGWGEMLKLSFAHLGNDLTVEDIIISYKTDKRGLLNEFLSAAGKAKVFYPKHLRSFLAPMLTLYCARLIIAVHGDDTEKEEVKEKIIHEIKKSMNDDRGLKGFPDEVSAVVHKLEHMNIKECGRKSRPKQVDRYIEMYYEIRGLSKTNVFLRIPFIRPRNTDQVNYLKYKKREAQLGPPASRNGSMIDKEQEKNH